MEGCVNGQERRGSGLFGLTYFIPFCLAEGVEVGEIGESGPALGEGLGYNSGLVC